LDKKGPSPWLKMFQNAREWCSWDRLVSFTNILVRVLLQLLADTLFFCFRPVSCLMNGEDGFITN
jgi:hypothetical protein